MPGNRMLKLFHRYMGLPKEIYVLALGRMINSLGAFVHPLLTMILTSKLGLLEDEAGTLITVLLATQMPVMLIGGKLADKFGRRKLVITFQLLGASAYMVCGLLPVSQLTIYLIMAASYCYSLTYPALEAITMDVTNADQRKESFALLYMGMNLGFVFGPMVGGMLLNSHLPWLFLGDALTTVISTILFMIFIKETLPKKESGSESVFEEYTEESVCSVLLKRKIIVVFALIMMVLQFAYCQWTFALPLQMGQLFENGAQNYGLLASFNGLLVIIITPLVTPFVRKTRALTGTVAGGIMYAVAFAMLIYVKSLELFYLSMFIFTVGEIVMTIDAGVFIANMLPSSHRGRIDSVVSSITNMGRVISPMIIGWVIAAANIKYAWLVLAGAAFFGSVGMAVLKLTKHGKKQIDIVSESSL